MPVIYKLGCRGGTLTTSQQVFAVPGEMEGGVTRGSNNPVVFDSKLEVFDNYYVDVDEPCSVFGGALDVTGKPNVHEHRQRGSSGSGIFCGTNVIGLAVSVVKFLCTSKSSLRGISAYIISERNGILSSAGVLFYVDADHAPKTTGRRSTSCAVVVCADSCVSFPVRTQIRVYLFSTEAESGKR